MSKQNHRMRAHQYAHGTARHAHPLETEGSRISLAWLDGYEAARRDLRKAIKGTGSLVRATRVYDFLKPRR